MTVTEFFYMFFVVLYVLLTLLRALLFMVWASYGQWSRACKSLVWFIILLAVSLALIMAVEWRFV